MVDIDNFDILPNLVVFDDHFNECSIFTLQLTEDILLESTYSDVMEYIIKQVRLRNDIDIPAKFCEYLI